MENKVSTHDITKIWTHFDRFALYDDLKQLHAKTLPEIAKFEQRIIDYNKELETQKMVVSRLDSVLTQKASKIAIK